MISENQTDTSDISMKHRYLIEFVNGSLRMPILSSQVMPQQIPIRRKGIRTSDFQYKQNSRNGIFDEVPTLLEREVVIVIASTLPTPGLNVGLRLCRSHILAHNENHSMYHRFPKHLHRRPLSKVVRVTREEREKKMKKRLENVTLDSTRQFRRFIRLY